MSREVRDRRTPYVLWRERVELSAGNIRLRLLLFLLAVAIAVYCFGGMLSDVLTPKTGWQAIEAANPETGICQQFTLNYNIGTSNLGASAELKGVAAAYTEAMEYAYRVLSNLDMEHYVNLRTINTQVGEELSVDPLTYRAFETFEAAGSRYPYYAPMLEQYAGLFSCTEDADAEQFDPSRSSEAAQFAAEIADFAGNADMVQVVLLGDNTLRLDVAPEYLAYAEENGIESFVDFGFLMNAFLCDAAADALIEQGYTNGILTSFDGFSHALGDEGMGIRVYDLTDGKVIPVGAAQSEGEMSVVSFHAFPLTRQDQERFYLYADGTIRAPFVGEDALLHTAASSLITAAPGSAAELAVRTHAAFAADSLDESTLSSLSYILLQNGKLQTKGDLLHLQ